MFDIYICNNIQHVLIMHMHPIYGMQIYIGKILNLYCYCSSQFRVSVVSIGYEQGF